MPKHKDWTTLHSHIVEDLKVMSLSKTALKHHLNISTLWNYCKKITLKLLELNLDTPLCGTLFMTNSFKTAKPCRWHKWQKNITCLIPQFTNTANGITLMLKGTSFVKKFCLCWLGSNTRDIIAGFKHVSYQYSSKKHKLRYSTLLYYCKRNNLTFLR